MMLVQQALTTQSCIGNRLEPGIGLSHKPVVASATAAPASPIACEHWPTAVSPP
jgi:hypothetical protein